MFIKDSINPFANGLLTTDGQQYSAEVSNIGDTYTEIEKVEIPRSLSEQRMGVIFNLVGAVKSSGVTESVLWKWQGSDDGINWEDLCAEQTVAASAAAYADVSISGNWKPTGNLKTDRGSFFVRMVVKSGAAAGETASGKTKNSSSITPVYWSE
jgi:hypothetical protein